MPKRTNVSRTNGGAKIEEVNDLHDKLVQACHQALENEVKEGSIKGSTLNTIRQVCADAGVAPTREASHAMEGLLWALPDINPDAVARVVNR